MRAHWKELETTSGNDLASLKSMRVLYVEDDPDIRDELAHYLGRRVGKLYPAVDGAEGWRLFQEERPDLVVTDILMPVMDGLAMVQRIREGGTNTPVIVTTAYNEDTYFLRSIELGIDRYVLKPIDPQQLITAMTRCAESLLLHREREATQRFNQVILDLHPGLLMVVKGQELEYLNKPFLDLLGVSCLAEWHGYSGVIGDILADADGIPFSKNGPGWLPQLLQRPGHDEVVYLCPLQGKASRFVPHVVKVNSVPGEDRHIISFTRISLLEEERKQLREKAYTDPLTGLLNRERLETMMDLEMQRSQRYGVPLCCILFDIDHFKRVNDTFGHPVGDDVLIQLASMITAHIRVNDMLARTGGEEFLILSPCCDRAGARELAEKLRRLVADTPFAGVTWPVTCSFGVAQFQPGDTQRSLVERADRALYQAKAGGRNRVMSEAV